MSEFSSLEDRGEQLKSKEEQWKEAEKKLEAYFIEENIKETVVALNAWDLPTTNSCEGHDNHGRIVPWVTIKAPNEPNEHYIGQRVFEEAVYEDHGISKELLAKIESYWVEHGEKLDELKLEGKSEFDGVDKATVERINAMEEALMQKHGISREDDRCHLEAMKKMDKEIENAVHTGILKEKTPEYVAWEEEMKKINGKIKGILEEFYKNRQALQENAKIILSKEKGMPSLFLRSDGGGEYVDLGKEMTGKEAENYENILQGKISDEKKQELKNMVDACRTEFKEFAEFLENKFFEQ